MNTETNDYRLIVFDWDGTLMDSEAHIVASMRGAMRDLELEPLGADQIRNVIGLGMREAINTLYPDRADDEFAQAFTAHYRAYYFAPEQPQELFEGARETLATLREHGYLLAVATGKSRRGLDRALKEVGVDGVFDTTRCADETASKPDPRMLREVMDALGAAPERTIMVGDTEFDLEMAARAGTASVGVTYGVHAVERLWRHKPLTCVERLIELPVVLGHEAPEISLSTAV